MNGKAHILGGAIGGPIAGATLSIQANRHPTFAEACGWVTAGIAGAKLPDLLEPAYCPRHRRFVIAPVFWLLTWLFFKASSFRTALKHCVLVLKNITPVRTAIQMGPVCTKFGAIF